MGLFSTSKTAPENEPTAEANGEDDTDFKDPEKDDDEDDVDDLDYSGPEALLHSLGKIGMVPGPLPATPGGPPAVDVGFACQLPYRRRVVLPEPKQKEKKASLWSVLKANVGKDLSHVCLPVYFNEPISTLQKCFEQAEYSELLDRAAEWGKQGNQLLRALHVAAFAVSSYASTDGRTSKPFNPLLGETYEGDWQEKGLKFFSEKVSHHPAIVACHCTGRGWTHWGDCNLKHKFWGPSITVLPTGTLSVQFDDGELYQWSQVTSSIQGIVMGSIYVDHHGLKHIKGNRDISIQLRFKKRKLLDRNPHVVRGVVRRESTGENMAVLLGHWDQSMYFVAGGGSAADGGKSPKSPRSPRGSGRSTDLGVIPPAGLLWQRAAPSEHPTRYNLSAFAITLNEITPGLEEMLPPTDSRKRPDQRALENGDYDFANEEKLRLEQKQREARKVQESGWHPRWFKPEGPNGTWTYQGGYWERRAQRDWSDLPNIYSTEAVVAATAGNTQTS